ncbi:uncharacterized protein TrAtP1_011238 [Trichoderma atroviride]|uniref:uncharacterized protein n=1 Tax=Hypocrea atroviridis TaxID=63577 RepID=UPI00332A2F24|nr:hypothetical protein TrAtP1_011238 [Trichoderma atroviride]
MIGADTVPEIQEAAGDSTSEHFCRHKDHKKALDCRMVTDSAMLCRPESVRASLSASGALGLFQQFQELVAI